MADLVKLLINDSNVGSAFRGVLARQQRFDHASVPSVRATLDNLSDDAAEELSARATKEEYYASLYASFPGGVL